MTPVGRDWPKGYERGLDNAAISAILRIQKAGRAVHLGNVSYECLLSNRCVICAWSSRPDGSKHADIDDSPI